MNAYSPEVKKYKIPSKSEPGVFRHLILLADGRILCDCPAIKKCWHIKIIEKIIIKDYALCVIKKEEDQLKQLSHQVL